MIRAVPYLIVALLAAWTAPGASQPAPGPAVVRVAAASDLRFALEEIVRRFREGAPSVRVEPTYGSSGNFHAQLRQRAPFDLYLSADVEYPRDLVARGVGSTADLFVYALGRLVVWTPNGTDLPFERDGLRALAGAGRIAIANPRHAPYGRAAEAAMRRAGIWDRARPHLVLGENIAQAAQFVQSGGADAGIVAKSLAVAPSMREAGRFWEVPQSLYPELRQGGLILPWSTSRDAAARFRDFLIGPEGRRLLSGFGFGLPG